jgi:putative membrane protein
MSKIMSAAAVAGLIPACAWAQPWPDGYWRHAHMMSDGRWAGWGGWFVMMFGSILMLVPLAVLIAAVIFAARWAGSRPQGADSRRDRAPLDILKERFARGEIDKAEFEDRRRVLGE